MRGNGKRARVFVWIDRVRLALAHPFMRERAPSEEVRELEQHLREARRDDVKLRDMHRRSQRLLRDNHLVSDVERALGLRS